MPDLQLAALERAELIRLAQQAPELEYVFRHALIQDAAYGSLLKVNRRELHRAIGEAIEGLHPEPGDDLAPVLARHFAEADQPEKALGYFRRAGDTAAGKFANAEAVEQYDQALDMAARAGMPRGELWRRRGRIRELTGDQDAARADLKAALDEARTSGDRRAEWQALLDLGFLWAAQDYARAGDCFRQATDLARKLNDRRVLAESLNRLGNWYANVEQPHMALSLHQEAMAHYGALHDDIGLAETYDLLGITGLLSCDHALERDSYDHALALFRALNRPRNIASSLAPRAIGAFNCFCDNHVLPITDLPTALREANEAWELAHAIGWSAGDAFALIVAGALYEGQGDYSLALDALHSAADTARRIGHRHWLSLAGSAASMLWFSLGDLSRGLALAEAAAEDARALNSPFMERQALGFMARGVARYGSPAQRAAVEARLTASLGAPASPPAHLTLSQRLCWVGRAELMLARGDGSGAINLIEALNASLPNRGVWGTREAPRMLYLRGMSRLVLKMPDDAENDFAQALTIARAQGARPAQVEILHGLARAARMHGASGAEHRAAADRLAHELAAAIPDAAMRVTYEARVARENSELDA